MNTFRKSMLLSDVWEWSERIGAMVISIDVAKLIHPTFVEVEYCEKPNDFIIPDPPEIEGEGGAWAR